MCAANNHSINAAFSRGRLQRHWRRRWPEPQLNVAHGCPTFLGKFFTYSDPEISRGRCVFCRGPFEGGRLRFLTASFNHRRPKRKINHCLTGASTAVTSTIKKQLFDNGKRKTIVWQREEKNQLFDNVKTKKHGRNLYNKETTVWQRKEKNISNTGLRGALLSLSLMLSELSISICPPPLVLLSPLLGKLLFNPPSSARVVL